MYGIEYSTFASLIQNENLDEKDTTQVLKAPSTDSLNINTNKLDISYNSQQSTSTVKLLARLQTMNECPDYLSPKLSYKNNSLNFKNHDQIHYTDDFILLSEFSEIEGPKPLLTIPTDGGTGFNKNEYSLHLMCVDFHSHLNQQRQSSSSSSSKFSFTKDTSIINYWDISSTMVTACVHHFTLYDLEARGFVRPFCLAYISYDQKPLGFFEQIKEKFTLITDLFKKSNFNQFRIELEQRCADLKFTRDFFLKWSSLTEKKEDSLNLRLKLANELNLDNKTFSRLNSSCINEANKILQITAIENLLKEMESVLEVVLDELNAKNWIKEKTIVPKLSRNNSANFQQINPKINSEQRNRALTYPTSSQQGLMIKIEKNLNSKKVQDFKKKAKLHHKILIGNSNILCSDLNILNNLNPVSSPQSDKKKIMKRLHQLCSDTARQAINELRLMQRHFSTPYYLLKYKQLTQASTKSNTNLFWSVTCGDCLISDFSTSIDTLNFNKQSLERKSNSSTIRTQENTLIQINNNVSSSEKQDISTPFYSPLAERTVYLDAMASSSNSQSQSRSTSIKKIETVGNFSWSNLEQFLDLDEEEDEDELNEPEQTEDADFYSNQEILYDDPPDPVDNSQTVDLNLPITREENEYDFANSLLTIEYKPYNQYAANFNPNNLYLSNNSLALSLSSSSVGLYYKTLNSLKFQSNLTDKLVQIQEFNFEETLKKLLTSFPTIFSHLLYSLLKGRPVICVSRYCSDMAYLQAVVDCLSNFIPNSFYCLNGLSMSKSLNNIPNMSDANPKFTSSPNQQSGNFNYCERAQLRSIHERKPIRLNDLKYCKLFGLNLLISKDGCCSNECNDSLTTEQKICQHKHKHYHLSKSQDTSDIFLIYVPITIRNYVSILDLDNLTFQGPKYDGTHLVTCLNKCKSLQQDSIIYLYLLSNVFNFYVKIAFLYNYSILFEHDSNELSLNTSRGSLGSTSSSKIQKDSDFMNKSVQLSKAEDRGGSGQRKMSCQLSITSNQSITRKDRILRYYSLIRSSKSNEASQQPANTNKSRPDVDLDLLKSILTSVASSSPSSPISSFESSDLKIVLYILKTLKIKQIYMYNLALHKKELRQLNKNKSLNKTKLNKNSQGLIQVSNSNNNGLSSDCVDSTLVKTDIQFPLLVEYEEITLFNSNAKKSF